MTWKTRISGVDECLSGVTYSYYSVDNRHHHGRDGGDDGVDDTTDGRNDSTLKE